MTPQTSPRLHARGMRSAADLSATRPHGDRLRYIAGCRCDDCRQANTEYERDRYQARLAGDWNGIVKADAARKHLFKLSKAGVGRRASIGHQPALNLECPENLTRGAAA